MSEKRFEFYSDDYLIGVLDNVTGKTLNHFATIDLLNEQQATIEELKKQRVTLYGDISHQYEELEELRNENERQQATINSLKDFIKKEFPKSYKHILEGFE